MEDVGESTEQSRKKTSGGVFMTLLKKHPSMTQEIKKRLQKSEKDRVRAKRFTLSLMSGLEIGEKQEEPA